MATYYRGIGDFKEALIARRRGLANQLANDDKRRERGERSGLLSKTQRETTSACILELNWVIRMIEQSSILTVKCPAFTHPTNDCDTTTDELVRHLCGLQIEHDGAHICGNCGIVFGSNLRASATEKKLDAERSGIEYHPAGWKSVQA